MSAPSLSLSHKEAVIFEEHSSVLPEWKRRGVRQTTLIYLDAHLDLQLISESRLKKLESCLTADEMARFEKSHHLMPDEGYSYSIEDFLYPAHCLGMVDRLIWVCPGEKTPDLSSVLKRALQFLEGIPLEDLASIKQVDNHLEADLLGLPVVICTYRDLESLPIPSDALIDIDIDYFISTSNDHVWIDPSRVFQALNKLPLNSDFVTLTRSVSSGFTPLRHRFIADYLAALFRDDTKSIEHWSRLYQLDQMAQQGDTGAALKGCITEAAGFPECAATHYLISICEQDVERTAQARQRAERLCSGYSPSVLRSACEVINRIRKFDLPTFEQLEHRLENESVAPDELPLANLVVGVIAGRLGQLRKTFKYHLSCKKASGRQPRLNSTLGQLLLEAGHTWRAIAFYRAALEDDNTRPRAYLQLGALYLKQENFELARESLLKACEMLPAFREPVRLLAHLYQRTGDHQNYRASLKRYQQMNCVIAT